MCYIFFKLIKDRLEESSTTELKRRKEEEREVSSPRCKPNIFLEIFFQKLVNFKFIFSDVKATKWRF